MSHRIRWLMVLAALSLLGATTRPTPPARPTATDLPPPTLVTLRLRDADPEAAFADLFAQAHVSMRAMERSSFVRSGQTRVNVEMVNRPYIEALLELCRQTAMEPLESSMTASGIGLSSRIPRGDRPAYTSTPEFRLRRGLPSTKPSPTTTPATTRSLTTRPSWVDLPAVAVGPFSFIARDIERRRWIEIGGGESGDWTYVTILTLLDPNVRVHSLASQMEVVEAIDEQGRSLLAAKPSPIEVNTRWDSGNWICLSSAKLAYPPPDAHRIASLKLQMHGSIVTRSEKIEIADLDRVDGVEHTAHGLRYRLDKLKGSAEKEFIIPLTVFRDGRDDEQWKELCTMMRDERSMRITDERERPVRLRSRTSDLPGKQGLAIELRVARETQPATYPGTNPSTSQPRGRFASTRPVRMVWTIAVEVNDVVVPLEFRNLPLP